jgi:transposase-like protein
MPQLQLPIFPAGAKEINRDMAVQCKDGKVAYFHGHLPVFQHPEDNVKSFRFFTSQMIDAGTVKAREIAEAFGVPLATVKRYVKLYREQGAEGFFELRSRQRSETKLTDEIKEKAQQLLENGKNVAEVGRELNVLPTTLHKAIRSQRLEFKKKR